MKKFLLFACMLGLMAAMPLASCSDDESGDNGDGGNAPVAKYAEDATRIEINDPDAPFNELELTAAGRYFMTVYYTPLQGVPVQDTRADAPLTGTYTKEGDKYVLDGFGKILMTDDHKVTIEFNGKTESYSFTNTPKATGSWNCSAFANEWTLIQLRVRMSGEGQTIDKTFASWAEFDAFTDSFEEDDEDNDVEYARPMRKALKKLARAPQDYDYGQTRYEQLIVSEYGFLFPKCYWFLNGQQISYDYGIATYTWGATGNNKGVCKPVDVDGGHWADSEFGDHFDMSMVGSNLRLESRNVDEEDGEHYEMYIDMRYKAVQ